MSVLCGDGSDISFLTTSLYQFIIIDIIFLLLYCHEEWANMGNIILVQEKGLPITYVMVYIL